MIFKFLRCHDVKIGITWSPRLLGVS